MARTGGSSFGGSVSGRPSPRAADQAPSAQRVLRRARNQNTFRERIQDAAMRSGMYDQTFQQNAMGQGPRPLGMEYGVIANVEGPRGPAGERAQLNPDGSPRMVEENGRMRPAIGNMRQVAPRYYEGDEYLPGSLPVEDRVELQKELIAAGLISTEDVRFGMWDEKSAASYRTLLISANQQGVPVEQALSNAKVLADQYGYNQVDAYKRNPFVVPVFEEPDPDTLATEVLQFMEQRVGRDATPQELSAASALLEGVERDMFNVQVEAARMEHNAVEDANEAMYNAQVGIGDGTIPEEIETGSVQGVDVGASRYMALRDYFGNAIKTREGQEETALNQRVASASYTSTDVMGT